MIDHGNLSDPAYEPTDEQLMALSKRAFAHVRAAHQASLQKLRAQIAVERDAALRDLERELATTKTKKTTAEPTP